MTKRLYYVRCVAKFGHGTDAEREVKEQSRQYDAMVVDTEGWHTVVKQLADFAYDYWVDHPTSKLVKVTYGKICGTIFFQPENKDCGGTLLKMIPIQQFYLAPDKKTVLYHANEFAEEE